ncbi:hypothetical protein BE17_19785, partial [Sorangium cellulosum]
LNFRDERYLPFEGAGAESTWRLELPLEDQAFDMDTLSDVVIHLRYTARDGGVPLRNAARAARDGWLEGAGGAEGTPLARMFSLRQEFSVGWQGFLDEAGTHTLELALGPERFPFQLRSKEIKIERVEVYVKLKPGKALSFDLHLQPFPGNLGVIELPSGGTGLVHGDGDCPGARTGTWVLSAQGAAPGAPAAEIDDIALIVHYTAASGSV